MKPSVKFKRISYDVRTCHMCCLTDFTDWIYCLNDNKTVSQ